MRTFYPFDSDGRNGTGNQYEDVLGHDKGGLVSLSEHLAHLLAGAAVSPATALLADWG